MNKSFFQKALPHIVAVIVFLIVNVLYFTPQLQGKRVESGDTISSAGMTQEMRQFYERTGERTLWTNAMFGGMPTYQIGAVQPTNLVKYVEHAAHLFIGRPIGYFFAMMATFYVLMLLLGVNPWLSMVGAVAFSLTTNNIVLFGAGHMTKLRVFAFFGIMTAGMILAFRKKYLVGAVLFALGLSICLYANHVQMVYYLFITYLIYGLVELYDHFKRGELADFGKAAGFLVVAGLVALGSSTSNLWTTYEYSKDTMRGDPILKSDASVPQSSSNTEGLEWSYAMQYSNGFLDLFSSFIPGVVGGGAGEPVGSNSAFANDLKKRGGRNLVNLRAPLYWGEVGKTMSTAGPIYYGAVIFFLFFLGLLVVKGPVKWWVGTGVLLTLLLSMGDNFAGLSRLFFDYFPMYSKFRTPNSILAITSFLVPILGILAVSRLLKGDIDKKEALRALYISTGVLGGTCLFFALMGSSFFDFSHTRDAAYEARMNINLTALREDRASLMQSDSFRSLALILVAAGLLWAFLNNKIKQSLLIGGLALITVWDLWQVDKRYLGHDKFVEKSQFDSFRRPRPVDEIILKDVDPNFRVQDLTINTYNSSSTSYFHKTIGGYHPAKLQRYQDMIERHITPQTQLLRSGLSNIQTMSQVDSIFKKVNVLNMLNTKYFIINPDGNPLLNTNILGNAWFVDSYKVVNSANEEIDGLRGIDPARQAIVHADFQEQLEGLNIQKNGTIELTSYEPNHLTYKSNTSSEQLAVFSEIWYGPNKGWNVYVDGQSADHIRANYALRAMRVPAGEHTIEFKFQPASYYVGTKATLFFSLLVLLGLGWIIWQGVQKAQEEAAQQPKPSPKPKTQSTRARKTKGNKRKK
ncbi:MAG: YfhO family protein [Bacteroidota bacterium]